MRAVSTATLTTRPPFSSLFAIDPAIRAEIAADMRAQGFDPSKPIDVWDDGGELVVVDGHTRLAAARDLGLSVVPVSAVPYADEPSALRQAIYNQRARRNLTQEELINAIEAVDRALRQPKGGNRNPSGANQYSKVKASRDALTSPRNKSAAETAAIVGTSPAMVERARQVYGDQEARQEVANGTSISAAAKGVSARKWAPSPSEMGTDSAPKVWDEPWHKAAAAGRGAEVSLGVALREIEADLAKLRTEEISVSTLMADRRVSARWNAALRKANAVAAAIRVAMRDEG